MAIVRTSLALIGFGFTIFTFFHTLSEKYLNLPAEAPRRFGGVLIILGVVLLTLGILNHWQEATARRRQRQELFDLKLVHQPESAQNNIVDDHRDPPAFGGADRGLAGDRPSGAILSQGGHVMDAKELVPLVAQGALFLIIASIGLQARWRDVLAAMRNTDLVLKGLLAVNIIVPIAALIICSVLPIDPADQDRNRHHGGFPNGAIGPDEDVEGRARCIGRDRPLRRADRERDLVRPGHGGFA